MNFAVCGLSCDNTIPDKKNRPNIIFSTFVNFECFYLKMLELSPGYINNYYDNCALLIDEADSILIDEITNGTIVSRDVRSNAKQILQFIYDKRMESKNKKGKKKISAKKILRKVKQKWPECEELTVKDIKQMFI